MIFITVGTQLPFDRLVISLDNYFNNKKVKVFAQIGPTDKIPKYIKSKPFLSPIDIDELYKKSSLIIAHAGTGSIISALKYKKPIIIMPRKASLGEHRNDHQLSTIDWAKKLDGVTVANDEHELVTILDSKSYKPVSDSFEPYAQTQLLNFLKEEIEFD